MNRHHATCVCSWCVSSGHTHVYTCACDYACAAHTGTGGDGRRVPAVHRGQIQNRLITEVHPQRSASGSPNFLQKHTGTDWDKSRSNKMISQCTPAKHVHPSAKGTACESVRPTARDWKSRPGIFPYFNVIKLSRCGTWAERRLPVAHRGHSISILGGPERRAQSTQRRQRRTRVVSPETHPTAVARDASDCSRQGRTRV